jgi:hypothetical protein
LLTGNVAVATMALATVLVSTRFCMAPLVSTASDWTSGLKTVFEGATPPAVVRFINSSMIAQNHLARAMLGGELVTGLPSVG